MMMMMMMMMTVRLFGKTDDISASLLEIPMITVTFNCSF